LIAEEGRAEKMGRGRDRGERRRGFDDDQYSPPDWGSGRPQQSFSRAPRENAAPSGPAIDATVKWFNAEKGFGFVELADGSGDVFLHAAVLEAAGHHSVDPGAKLSVQVGVGQKGRQVTAVLGVDTSAVVAPRERARPSTRPSSPGRGRPDPATASDIEGTVKWFNSEKGFGFVVCEDGEKDVFVHISIVERAGLGGLDEGQRVAMKVVKTPKGREAISLTLLG
jgi:cold shock protein